MSSADAVRMRRVRAHNKNDHSLCTGKTCPTVREEAAAAIVAEAPDLPPTDLVPAPNSNAGPLEAATQAFVDALPYRGNDPRALLCLTVVQLARRVDETKAVPAAVREFRVLLMHLVESPNSSAGPVDEVRLRAAQRMLDKMIAKAA